MNRAEVRAAILAADDLPREPIEVPWLDDKLYVRGLTADEKDAWLVRTMPDGEFRWTENLTAGLVATTLVMEDGTRVFDDSDAAELGKKGATAIRDIFNVAMRLSGMSENTATEIEADFVNAQGSDSSID